MSASEQLLNVRIEFSDSAAVVRLAGECDASVAGLLERALRDAGEASPEVHLDLRELGFLDSVTLHVLYKEHLRLQARGSRLILTEPQPGVRRVLEIAEMFDYFEVRDGELRPESRQA